MASPGLLYGEQPNCSATPYRNTLHGERRDKRDFRPDGDGACSPHFRVRVFNAADKIADRFDPLDIIIRKFKSRAILDRYDQFKTVEPVGAEVVSKVRLIGDPFDINVQIFGNEGADLFARQGFLRNGCWLNRTRAPDRHHEPPPSVSWRYNRRAGTPLRERTFDVVGQMSAATGTDVPRRLASKRPDTLRTSLAPMIQAGFSGALKVIHKSSTTISPL